MYRHMVEKLSIDDEYQCPPKRPAYGPFGPSTSIGTRFRTGWNDLPKEIMTHIIHMLDFPDKQNMMLVNGLCYSLAQTARNYIEEISIKESENSPKTMIFIRYQIKVNGRVRIANKMVEYRSNTPRQEDCPECTRLAFKAFLKLIKKSYIRKNITVEVPCFEGLMGIWQREMTRERGNIIDIHTKSVILRTNDHRLAILLLNSIQSPRVDLSLLANDYQFFDRSIMDVEKTKMARSIVMWSLQCNVTDEQLLRLNAKTIQIKSDCISTAAIIKLIKQWQKERRIIERLQISAPRISIKEIQQHIECKPWKELTGICMDVWREVDESGFTHVIKGGFCQPAAIAVTEEEGMPTFKLRVVKLTDEHRKAIMEQCGNNKCSKK